MPVCRYSSRVWLSDIFLRLFLINKSKVLKWQKQTLIGSWHTVSKYVCLSELDGWMDITVTAMAGMWRLRLPCKWNGQCLAAKERLVPVPGYTLIMCRWEKTFIGLFMLIPLIPLLYIMTLHSTCCNGLNMVLADSTVLEGKFAFAILLHWFSNFLFS